MQSFAGAVIFALALALPLPAALSAQGCVLVPPTSARITLDGRAAHIRAGDGLEVVFDRTTRTWRRVGARVAAERDPNGMLLPGAPTPNLFCYDAGDTVPIAPGAALVAVGDADTLVAWAIRHAGRLVPVRMPARLLPPRLPEDDLGDPSDPARFSPYVSATLHDGDLVWLGLYGTTPDVLEPPYRGYPSYYGGLLRYSLRTGMLAPFAPPELRGVAVTSLAAAGGTLWIGTKRRAGGAEIEYAGVGLVRLGRDGGFAVFGAGSTPLPDDMVEALAGAGDSLWIATHEGVAVLDTRTLRWDRRFFRTVHGLDSVYVRLDTLPPRLTMTTADSARQMMFLIMDELAITDRRAFLDAAARLDAGAQARMLALYEEGRHGWWALPWPLRAVEHEVTEFLAHPSLLPFVRQALRRGGDWQSVYLPSLVFRALGDSVWRTELRAAMASAPRRSAAWIAETLVDSGDTAGMRWLTEALRRPRLPDDTTPSDEGRSVLDIALFVAGSHPDTANTAALLALLAVTDNVQLMRAIWALESVPARVAAAGAIPDGSRLLLDYVTYARADTAFLHDSAGRAALLEVTRRALALVAARDGADGWHMESVAMLIRSALDLRDGGAVPMLIDLAPGALTSEYANEALIRLTGVEPPPLGWAERARIAAFWRAWWRSYGAGFTPVAPEAGAAAWERWRKGRRT